MVHTWLDHLWGVNLLKFRWIRSDCFHLDESVLLWSNPFPSLPVMVHTRLAILGGVDGMSLAKLDLVVLLECEKMPPDKGVIVWVGICGDE